MKIGRKEDRKIDEDRRETQEKDALYTKIGKQSIIQSSKWTTQNTNWRDERNVKMEKNESGTNDKRYEGEERRKKGEERRRN